MVEMAIRIGVLWLGDVSGFSCMDLKYAFGTLVSECWERVGELCEGVVIVMVGLGD